MTQAHLERSCFYDQSLMARSRCNRYACGQHIRMVTLAKPAKTRHSEYLLFGSKSSVIPSNIGRNTYGFQVYPADDREYEASGLRGWYPAGRVPRCCARDGWRIRRQLRHPPARCREFWGKWTSTCLRQVACHDPPEWNCPNISVSRGFRDTIAIERSIYDQSPLRIMTAMMVTLCMASRHSPHTRLSHFQRILS